MGQLRRDKIKAYRIKRYEAMTMGELNAALDNARKCNSRNRFGVEVLEMAAVSANKYSEWFKVTSKLCN